MDSCRQFRPRGECEKGCAPSSGREQLRSRFIDIGHYFPSGPLLSCLVYRLPPSDIG